MDSGRHRMISRKSMHGVTLVELMIVVVVIAILVSVAYPNYREFAARAKRSEAVAALLQIATNQERFFLQNNTYTQDMTALGFATTPNWDTPTGSYRVNVTAANTANFTARATFLLGGTEAGKCGWFQITGAGVRTSNPAADCWVKTR